MEDSEKRRHRERRDRDRDRERRRSEREKSSDSDREKEREKEKHRRERKDREREKEKERERAREKEREREREKREREREREKREREREKERERERKSREREREREREKRREYNSDDSKEEKERHRKRRRRERDDDDDGDDYKERESKSTRGESPAKKKSGEDELEKKEKKSREQEMEDEQQRLDEEMEKRRRRVQEWQELRRKKEESEREKRGEGNVEEQEAKVGKAWTLEGESDDDEVGSPTKLYTNMDVDDNENSKPDSKEGGDGMMEGGDSDNGEDKMVVNQNGGNGIAEDDDEIDPLDAFMNSMVLPEVEKLSNAVVDPPPTADDDKNGNFKDKKDGFSNGGQQPKKDSNKALGRIISGEDSDSDYGDVENDEENLEDEDDDEFMKRVKKTKAEKLSIVDHSKIDYKPFRKNFYIEVKEISRMTPEEVAAYRKELELKLHGKDVPKPIKTWHQTGLTSKILETIRKLNYEKPMPIQAQALPIIMSGRDCIGIAKTGSGKTLAFVLPMLRHIKDQPPVVAGDGPIGLIMAPTRELVQQIHSDIKKFAKALGIRCVPVYGGSGVAQQISELKRGTEIVVCTPGRMIDILCTSGGKISNLRRVTYLVLDEADRMFDMGFEPQITRIVQNIRPDRQTVLFSATFPRQVEILARKVLNKPVEIQVGGRSVVNKDITQLVEMRPESERFLRLLELLGEWCEKGKILIFVHTQEKCDALFRDLLKHGYPCLSLHGAKDQTDRESTISDFKSNVCNLLIATSVAARGLDVKELELVINFDVPNHYEDYVHRVGRTGRAGRKGCAITFISEDDARYAPDLVKALELSEQVVPDDLKALADGFMAKVNQGLEQAHGTGYGGSGFKFNEEEDEKRKAAKKAQAKEYGFEEDKSDSEDEDEGVRKAGGDISQQTALAQIAAMAAATKASTALMQNTLSSVQLLPNAVLPVSLPGVLGVSMPGTAAVVPGSGLPGLPNEEAARKAALQAALNLQHNLAKIQADAMPEHYEAELEINEFPQNARWKVTHKETLGPISEWTGAAITTRGQFFPPGRIPGPGERKLYLFIEGPTELSVKRAKAELKRVLEDISHQSLQLPGGTQPGRYQVL
ncbi:DEAD-box ATP-dependent RNA helicase 42 [Durio zibethinus]|uniref:RNA helicase n=1 Tax=Durio zibethinus TaxID=66656 RepID=A0A6P6AJW7_DURZI|nr:DEAD-box ATP-dependent RNA helicase 42 [Durio zibethinus]XP_022765163.1 DEAD-box ATP-dependent RNA helicase 42 [Durio zibethinus]XP_022765164.1 DEAD-box ATP-dependent RNA helicase 42 [Durio zibethinus]XP_022765165.1 DEAD-box ATP-dependent RNA helicase 42 [Durio zibethinus]